MPSHWLFNLALMTVGALVVRRRTMARLAKREERNTWVLFWREYSRPGHHKVGVLLGDSRYVGTVQAVDEVVATGNVWLEDVTFHDDVNSVGMRLDDPVCFTKEQPFNVYLVNA